MKSSSGAISIAASAQKLDCDNRIALRYYYRIADNLLKQADIYREEKNVIDLYIMLLRFSSLIMETIPSHRDYQVSLGRQRQLFIKKSANAIHELETLKPVVLRRIEELNRKRISQIERREQNHRNNSNDSSLEWPPSRKQNPDTYEVRQPHQFVGWDGKGQGSLVGQNTFSYPKAMGDQFLRLSLSIPRPKEETLSRHSILGPNGLRGQWQPPTIDKGVYPILFYILGSSPVDKVF